MDITRFALEKRVVTTVALILVFLAGLSSYFSLPRAEDPGFVVRTALVTAAFPGASPQRVEQLITEPLERAIQEIPELDYLKSESRTGVAILYVNIRQDETVMQPIWDNLRRKVEQAARELPDGIFGPFVNDEFGDVFGVILTLTGDGFNYIELEGIADQVRNELLKIRDVAKVEIQGLQEERIFVEYNNARLSELGLSAIELRNILQARNIIIPGGTVSTGDERIALEPSGNFETLEDLRQTVITIPASQEVVYLQDIVDIRRGYVDPRDDLVHATGNPALALGVSMQEGGNIITLGEDVNQIIAALEQRYPVGIEFDTVVFQPATVDKKVNDFVSNLLQAIIIVIAVMLISLGLRTGLIVAALIPMTMIASLLVMSVMSIGLDQMSLAALIIALGLLVDNAIVMSESIMVQMREGKPGKQAAIDTAKELRVPLLTSSLTTAAAFLPIYLAESNVGEYTSPIFLVVTIALLSSWVLALTMTPLLCVKFLKIKQKEEEVSESYNSRFYKGYRNTLIGILKHPFVSILVVMGIFLTSLWAFRFVEQAFFPRKDEVLFTAEFDFPIGTPIEKTEAVISEIEEFMRSDFLVENRSDQQGLQNWSAFVGKGAPRFVLPYTPEQPRSNYTFMLINATSYEVQSGIIAEMRNYVESNYPEIVLRLEQLQNGPPVTFPIEIRISGEDQDQLFNLVEEVKRELEKIPGTKNIGDDWGPRTKKLFVSIDQPRALRAGLSSQDIAVSLQTALSGFETTQFREGDQAIPIVMRSTASNREDINRLETMSVYSQLTGNNVPLGQVADIQVQFEPSKILRYNRYKTVTVHSGLDASATAFDVIAALQPTLQQKSGQWPIGYFYEVGGEIEASAKSQNSIAVKLPIAGLIIILLLVGQFNSIRKPAIILLTIPLGLIGVIIGLIVTGKEFGFMTLLGIISLAGIVINNAIVLIDRIQIEINENGFEPQRAIIEAAQRRLRPILLTTATTVAGLIPLYLGGGPLFESMAAAILFGLIFATLLTLGVVPILYVILFRLNFKGFKYPASTDG